MIAPSWWTERSEQHHQAQTAFVVYCSECRTSKHGASFYCACCFDCHLAKCKCGYPPEHGGKLSAREVRVISKANADAPENINTVRIAALLAHVAIIEAELEQARRPLLPGFALQ